jgi:hypothetical protein
MKMPNKIDYIAKLPNGKYRYSTPDEIKQAQKMKRRRLKLQRLIDNMKKDVAACEHTVCVDRNSNVCVVRTCVACGWEAFL